jgi:hypothetical protein
MHKYIVLKAIFEVYIIIDIESTSEQYSVHTPTRTY